MGKQTNSDQWFTRITLNQEKEKETGRAERCASRAHNLSKYSSHNHSFNHLSAYPTNGTICVKIRERSVCIKKAATGKNRHANIKINQSK